MAVNLMNRKHLILTGVPGIGKTTIVKSIVQKLSSKGIECSGFFTEEVRANGRRIGFDIITTNGQKGQLARVSDDEETCQGSRQRVYRVGQYSVNLLSFEQTALPVILQTGPSVSHIQQTLEPKETATKKVFVIDEVGKMEMFSQSFVQAIDKLISNQDNIIIATIPVRKGKPIPLVEKVRNGQFSRVYEVTRQNRDSLVDEILSELTSLLG